MMITTRTTTKTLIENNICEEFFATSHINNNSKTLEELLCFCQKTFRFIERNQASGHPFQIDSKRLENLFRRFALYQNKPSRDQEEQEKKVGLIRAEQSMAWLLNLEEAHNFPTYLQQLEVCCGDERILGFLALFYKQFSHISEKFPSLLKEWADFFNPYIEFIALRKFNFEKIFKFRCERTLKKIFYSGRIELNSLLSKLDTDLSFPSISFEDSWTELQNLREKFARKVQNRNSKFYKTLGQISFLSHLLLLVLEKDRKVFQLMCIWATIYFDKVKMSLTHSEDSFRVYFPYDRMKIDSKCWVKPLKKSIYFLEENSLEPTEVLEEFGIIESFLYLIFTNELNEAALLSCSREGGSGILLLKILDLTHANQEILKQSKSPICGNYGDFYESLVWILLQLIKNLLAEEVSSENQKHHKNTIIYKLINFAPSLKNLKPLIAHSYFILIKSFAKENTVIRKWLKVNCNFFPASLHEYLAEDRNDTLAIHLRTIAGSINEFSNLQESKFTMCQKKLAKIYKNFLRELLNPRDSDQLKTMGLFLMDILDLVVLTEFPLKKKFKLLSEFFSFLLYRYSGNLEAWDFYLINKHLEKIIDIYPEFNEMVLDQLLVKLMLIHKEKGCLISVRMLTFVGKLVNKGRLCEKMSEVLRVEHEVKSILQQYTEYKFNLIHNQRDDIIAKQDIEMALQKFVHYTLQWIGLSLEMVEKESKVVEVLEEINLLVFDDDLSDFLLESEEKIICSFYEKIALVKGFRVIRILYEIITQKLSAGEGVQLLVDILSNIGPLSLIHEDDERKEFTQISQKIFSTLEAYIVQNLPKLDKDFVMRVKQLVQIYQCCSELEKPIISQFCYDLLCNFKANFEEEEEEEERNSRYILNVISNLCFEFPSDIFFSIVIKDVDLWTLLVKRINQAITEGESDLTSISISINNFLSVSLKILQTTSVPPTCEMANLFRRLENDIKSIDFERLCRVNCKIIVQTVGRIADILWFLQDNFVEKITIESDTIYLMIVINALGNKFRQIQESLFEKIKQSPALQESFFLQLDKFLKIDEKLPVYNQTLIFHAFRNLSQKFWQDAEFAKKEFIYGVDQAAAVLFKKLIKQNLQEMNRDFYLISKTEHFALMNEIIEHTTKTMLTSYTGEKSSQTAEFLASWVTLVFKFYDRINPNHKILKDKLELTQELFDLLQLAVRINPISVQQFILNNTFFIQEILTFYETGPFEPHFLNALVFTFDAFASSSISDKIFAEMKLKQTLISKDKVSLEETSPLSCKIQVILDNISPNMKMIIDILTQTLLDNHLYNMAQIDKQVETPKSLEFKNTTPLFTILSTLIGKYPHLAVYLWFHKRNYLDLNLESKISFVDSLFEVGYFDTHEHDCRLLAKVLCTPLGVIFVNKQTCLDVSYLAISQAMNSSIQIARQSIKNNKNLTTQECLVKFYTALKFFALISLEIEQHFPKQTYLQYFSSGFALEINKVLDWWVALDLKILEDHSYYKFSNERKSLCCLLSSFTKNFIKRKLLMSSIKQDAIYTFKSDNYISLLTDTKSIQDSNKVEAYFQNVSQKIGQDLQILSKLKPRAFLDDLKPFLQSQHLLQVPSCKDIPIFQETSEKDFKLKLDLLQFKVVRKFYNSRSKKAVKEEKPKLKSLELYLKANNSTTMIQSFESQQPSVLLKVGEGEQKFLTQVRYFFHETIQNEHELSSSQRDALVRLKFLSEQISLKLGRFGSTGSQLDHSKDLISKETQSHLESLSCFERNLALCFIQEFAIFNSFELPMDIGEIRKEYHWMKSDFSSYLQNLNQLRVPPLMREEKSSPPQNELDFDCFNFSSQSSLIPSSSNESKLSEEQIKKLKDLLIIDDETFLLIMNQALESSSYNEFLSSSHFMADLFQELLQSPNFEIKLVDYCIFYLYCPFTSEIQPASLSLNLTRELMKCIFSFLKEHLKSKDYLIFQHRSVFEHARLKVIKESPLNELYMKKTEGLISFADLIIHLADESSEIKSVSLLKPYIDSIIKDICPKLKNLTVSTEPQNCLLFQPRIITEKSCNILLLDYHSSSARIPEIQLVSVLKSIETLPSEMKTNGIVLKQFHDKVFLTNEKDSKNAAPASKSPKTLQMCLDILESSVVSISTLLSNWKPFSGPNEKLYIQIIQKLKEKILDTQDFREFLISLFSLAEYLYHKKMTRSEQGESLVTCIIKLCFHFYTLIHIQKEFNKKEDTSELSKIGIFDENFKEKTDPLIHDLASLQQKQNAAGKIDFKPLFVNLCIKYQDLLSKLFLDNDCSDKLLCEFKVVQKSLRSVFDFSTKKKIFIEAIDTLFKKSGVSESSRTIIINRNDLLRSTLSQFKGLTINELREKVKIVFENESGIDAGGLTREWHMLIVEEIFNPSNGLFKLSNNQTTLQPHPSASAIPFHLQYLELAGIIVAKAILSGSVVGVNFTKSFIKHIMQRKIVLEDLSDLDYDLTKSLRWILENPVDDLEQSFVFQSEYFGQKIDKELILSGNKFVMNEDNKKIFVKKVCEFKMRDEISEETKAFTRGFHLIISPNFLQFLEAEELDLLIRGISSIDVDEMKAHAVMRNFTETDSELISWIWDVLGGLSAKELTAFLVFVSGSSRLQYGGFKENPVRFEKVEGNLNRLPVAHTCYRSIEILPYKSKEDLKQKLLYAISEGKEGFMIV